MTFYVSRNPNDELMNQRTDTPDHKLLQYFLVTGGVNRNNNNLYHHRPSYTHCCIQLKLIYATADEAAAVPYMFYRWFFCFFLFFFSVRKNETTVLGNGWTDFHETFTKRYWGKWSLQRRAAAWRMLMISVIYAMTLAQSPEGATHGGCVIKSWAREWI